MAPELGLIIVIAASIQQYIAADGASIAQLWRRDGGGGSGKRGIVLLYERVFGEGCQRDTRPDTHTLFGRTIDALERGDSPQTNQYRRRELAAFHVWIEVGAARDQHGLLALPGQHRCRLLNRDRGEITERRKPQHQ